MTTSIILVATLTFSTAGGQASMPVVVAFETRQACVAHLDQQLQAIRRVTGGPINAAILTYCEPRKAAKE